MNLGSTSQVFQRSTTRKFEKQADAENEKHFILLIEIEYIKTSDNSIYIMKHNSTIEKFIFPSQEKLNQAVSSILVNSKAYVSYNIPYQKEAVLTQVKPIPFNEEAYLQSLFPANIKEVIFKTEGLYYFERELPALHTTVQLTEDHLIVKESENGKIRALAQLKELRYIMINEDQTENSGELSLCFTKKGNFYQEIALKVLMMEQFISAILSLRSISKNTQELEIFMHQPDFSQKILGFGNEIDIDYQQANYKRLIDAIERRPYESLSTFQILDIIILNSNILGNQRIASHQMKVYLDQLIVDINDYLEFERDQATNDDQYVDSEDTDDNASEGEEESDDDEGQDSQDQHYSEYSDEEIQNHRASNQLNLIQNEKQKQQQQQQIISKVSKVLSFLKLQLTSSQFFKEILEEFDPIVKKVIELLKCHNPFIVQLASQVVFSILHSHSDYESKQETINKRILIKGTFCILKTLKRRLNYQLKRCERDSQINSLHVYSFYQILSAIMVNRKETTAIDEYWIVVREIFHIHDDLRLLHIIDRLSMTDNFWFTLGFTRIINELFMFLQKADSQKFKEMQAYFLVYTVQLIQHIYLRLASPLEAQRTQSQKVISKILFKNKFGVNVLIRMFKKSLFLQVDTSAELLRHYNWEESEWSEFFKTVLEKTFDNSEVQWDNDIKKELVTAIKKEIDIFQKVKRKHRQALTNQQKELTHPVHEFTKDLSIISKVNNLRWNFEEFRIKYTVDNAKFRVWKYYLSKLLNEGDSLKNSRPKLELEIKKEKLAKFWHELKLKFMPTQDIQERQYILKVMILLYTKNHKILRELRTLPYWLSLLEKQEYKKTRFLLLQLILATLSIPDQEIAQLNYQIFIESDGVRKIFNCLNLAFKDLKLNELQQIDPYEKQYQHLELHQVQSYREQEELRNYTECIENPEFMQNNTPSISIGILVFKILDLIMNKKINKNIYPLPQSKQFLLQNDNIYLLSQLLLIQNIDLTKEVLYFIDNHLNSQYSMYQFKKSGIIEFLMIYLETNLSSEAFNLLNCLQEVAFDYNDDLDLTQQFDPNDLKMMRLEENKYLKSSIFLRYIPLPLIMKAQIQDDGQEFIGIFKEETFEKATLIWNTEMRTILKQQILFNSDQLIKDLRDFAKKRCKKDGADLVIPKYDRPVTEIIKYRFIEEEVRCGQYYLRVWTSRKWNDQEFFWIPMEDEDDFLINLKNSINAIVASNQEEREESVDQQEFERNRLLIMLKSCLLALETFRNKRTFYLDEIRSIFIFMINKKDVEYNDTVKKILKVGIKTLNFAIDKNDDNLKEFIGSKGIFLVHDIIGHILANADSSRLLHSSSSNLDEKAVARFTDKTDESIDLPMSYEERQLKNSQMRQSLGPSQSQSLQIDKLEAKILHFCILTLNKLIVHDFDNFINEEIIFKVNLFKQMSQILDLSFQIYQNYSAHKKLQHDKNISLNQTSLQTAIQQTAQNQNQSDEKDSSRMVNSYNQKQLNLPLQLSTSKQIVFQPKPQPTPQHTQLRNFNLILQSDNKANIEQSHSKSQIVQSIQKGGQSAEKTKILTIDFTGQADSKSFYSRDKVLKLIFSLSVSILNLTRELSLNPALHTELITSGFAWKCLQQCFFALWSNPDQKNLVQTFLRDAISIMQHLTSFSYVFTHQLQTSNSPFEKENLFYQQTMQRYQSQEKKDIIIEFWFDMKKLLEKKILDNLILNFQFDDLFKQLRFPSTQDKEIQKFVKIFSIVEEKTPELIWNDQSREELSTILQEQLKNINVSFCDLIHKFDYSFNISELRIESIFVRHFNSDIYFKPSDVNQFAKSLLEQLKIRVENQHITDLSDSQFDNVLEITKALRNLIQYQNMLNPKTYTLFKDNLSLFCYIIRYKDVDVVAEQRIKTLTSIVFDILKIFSKNSKFSEYLLTNKEFTKLITTQLFFGDRDVIDIQDNLKLISILQSILNYENPATVSFLIKNGIIMFFLNSMFEQSMQREIRIDIAKMIKFKLDEVEEAVGAFMPLYFFSLMEFQQVDLPTSNDQMINIFLNNLDATEYENLFVRWNSDLKEVQHTKIKAECERILLSLAQWEQDFDIFDCKIPKEPYQKQNYHYFMFIFSPSVTHEIILQDIITRVYNKNPALYHAIEMDSYLKSICIQFDKQVFFLQQILNIFVREELDFEANNDDQVVQVRTDVFTVKQVRKKFKYISHQANQVLTALLLTIEQFLYNAFNPNKKRNSNAIPGSGGQDQEKIPFSSRMSIAGPRESMVQGVNFMNSFSSKAMASVRTSVLTQSQVQYNQQEINILANLLLEDARQIPELFFQMMQGWLIMPTFLNNIIPIEVRLTFLQLVILTLDIPDAVNILVQQLLDFTSKQIQWIFDEVDKKTIEDIMRLTIVEKMLSIGGKAMILQFFSYNQSQNFENLRKIHAMNKKLCPIIEHIFIIMSQHDVCRNAFLQLLQSDSEIAWKDVLKPRLDLMEIGQDFAKLWRAKPSNLQDSKKLYSISETTQLEEKLEESNLTKLKNMPFISKKAVSEIKRDEIMGEDELKWHQLISDLEQLQLKEDMVWDEDEGELFEPEEQF